MQRLFLIVGPSGTGKSTLVSKLKAAGIPEIVSITTRKPRPGEVEGVHYHFVVREAFEALRDAGEMIEWVEYNGNLYGSTKAEVDACLRRGRGRAVVIVEGRGAQQYKKLLPGLCEILFLYPPSRSELWRRLFARGDSESTIETRMRSVDSEMIYAVDADHAIPAGSPEGTLERALAIIGSTCRHHPDREAGASGPVQTPESPPLPSAATELATVPARGRRPQRSER